jgi:multidrug efflux pump subunit AcrB
MRNAIAWFAGNHVAANLLMLFILVAGAVIAMDIKLEIFPETELDRVSVTVAYPGASPAEVEEGVVRRIEENVAGIEGIKRIDSVAREGMGRVTIEVMTGWDIKKLLDDVKSEVDRITTLPDEAEEPEVRELTRRIQVISVAVYGDIPELTLKELAQGAKDDLTNLPGLTQADVAAVRDNEIHVEISEQPLRKYGLTLGSVADTVAQGSLDLPAGSVKAEEGEVLIRAKGRRYYAGEYRDIPVITRADGTRITLGQIAEIKEGFADVDMASRFQGKPAAIINVYRVADQSALDVAQKVRDYVARIRPGLPHGAGIDYYQDMSTILKSRIQLLGKNMFFGLILVSLLLALFLNVRLAFWVTLGIPISFAFGLIFLPYNDVSINMISLFAFIMVLGIVVDDAIIVGENVFRRQEAGMGRLAASVEGTLEVGRPVIFSVLTTMVAFAPLLTAGGTMGNFMRNIPIVVILVLLVFATTLMVATFVLLVMLVTLNRRMAEIEQSGIQVSSLTLSREENMVYLNNMGFKLTDAAMETLSVLAEARLDDDVLSGAEVEAMISGRAVADCDEAAGATRIKRLRDTLGNQLVSELLVKNIARHGYMLAIDKDVIRML